MPTYRRRIVDDLVRTSLDTFGAVIIQGPRAGGFDDGARTRRHQHVEHHRGPAFFDGYGRPVNEPNTSAHRVVQTLAWAMSSDWEEFQADPDLPTEIKNRTSQWRSSLLAYVERLPEHIDRLRAVISSAPR